VIPLDCTADSVGDSSRAMGKSAQNTLPIWANNIAVVPGKYGLIPCPFGAHGDPAGHGKIRRCTRCMKSVGRHDVDFGDSISSCGEAETREETRSTANIALLYRSVWVRGWGAVHVLTPGKSVKEGRCHFQGSTVSARTTTWGRGAGPLTTPSAAADHTRSYP
jgi:hypothetical protein